MNAVRTYTVTIPLHQAVADQGKGPAVICTTPLEIALDRVCPECKGAGVVPNPEWDDYVQALERWQQNPGADPDRQPAEPHSPEEVDCTECEGKGTTPTEAGLTILQFVERYK